MTEDYSGSQPDFLVSVIKINPQSAELTAPFQRSLFSEPPF